LLSVFFEGSLLSQYFSSVVFGGGEAEEVSMRAGAVEQMREGIARLHNVHDFLEERTGLRLLQFDELLRTVGG